MTIRKFTVPERPADEAERQAALESYRIAELQGDRALDAVVADVAAAFDMPTVLVSIVDRDIQWFPARVGMPLESTPRSISFCGHAIHQEGPFVVPDATADPRFAGNPLVIDREGLRFYAGAPLKTPEGHRIGTLCLIDRKVRPALTEAECDRLTGFASQVMDLLEARRDG